MWLKTLESRPSLNQDLFTSNAILCQSSNDTPLKIHLKKIILRIMRIADICPTCATYTNSICVIYDGVYLSNIDASPLDPLDTIFANINTTIGGINTSITTINNNITTLNTKYQPLTGVVAPTSNASFVGQLYVNTALSDFYLADSTGGGVTDWTELAKVSDIPSTPTLDQVLTVGDASDQNINLADNVGTPTRYVKLSPTGLSGSAEVYIEDTVATWYILSGFDGGVSNGTVKVGNSGATSVQITPSSVVYTDDFSGDTATLQFTAYNQVVNFPESSGNLTLTVNGIAADNQGDIRLYGNYVAKISQAGTNPPTLPIVHDDTLGAAVTTGYTTTGIYTLISSTFDPNTTVVFIQLAQALNGSTVRAEIGAGVITLYTAVSGVLSDDVLTNAYIEIRTY